MSASNAVSQRKNLVFSFSSLLKISGITCGKRCSCVTLVKASVIGCVLSDEGKK